MKRGLTHLSIWLILLLGMTLVLSSVTFAHYESEKSEKTLSLRAQNKWMPAVTEKSGEFGTMRTFSVTNNTTSDKTVVLRLETSGEINHLGMTCTIKSGETVKASTPVESLIMYEHGYSGASHSIYCAIDADGREMTWTLSPGETLEVTVTDNNSQTIVEGAVSLSVKCCNG